MTTEQARAQQGSTAHTVMTITPSSPSTEIRVHRKQRPAFMSPHVIAGPEPEFIAAALEGRKFLLEGIETYTDHQLVESFLEECSATGSAETQKTYMRHLNRFRSFMRSRFELGEREQPGERFLSTGDTPAIDAFAQSLRRLVNTTDPETGKPLMAKSTYNCIVASLSSFYKWCGDPARRAMTGIYSSPMPTKLQMKKDQRKAKSLNIEQLVRVFDGARTSRTSPTKRRDEVVLRLLLGFGCRATEMVNIRWDDIHLDGEVPRLHIRKGKGSKERWVALDDIVLDRLSQLRELQPSSEWLLPKMRDPSKHITRQGLWKLTRRSGKESGIHVSPHLMRHSHATISYRETKDPKLVQATLGHSDVSTTLGLYVDENDGDSSTRHISHLL